MMISHFILLVYYFCPINGVASVKLEASSFFLCLLGFCQCFLSCKSGWIDPPRKWSLCNRIVNGYVIAALKAKPRGKAHLIPS